MRKQEFDELLAAEKMPLVVEFWAEWCGPCRSMEPGLKKAADENQEKVKLVRINVDENPEIASAMKIYGIPSMVAFKNGKELFRKTGMQNYDALNSFFVDAANGVTDRKTGVSPINRAIRLMIGFFLLVTGLLLGTNWIMIAAGALFLLWAVHDRCPVISAVKSFFRPSSPKITE